MSYKAPTVDRRLWIIAYDVSDDRLRRTVAKLLAGWGYRIQYSAFLVEMTDVEREGLVRSLDLLDEEPEAAVRFYPFCENCQEQNFGPDGADLVRALRGPWQVGSVVGACD